MICKVGGSNGDRSGHKRLRSMYRHASCAKPRKFSMWYSHRVTSLCGRSASGRSVVRPSNAFCGAATGVRPGSYFLGGDWARSVRCRTRSEASGRETPSRRPYRLMSRLGSSPRKLLARTSSARRHSPCRSALHRYLEIACIRRVGVRSRAQIVIHNNDDLMLGGQITLRDLNRGVPAGT
jgi:hypothetical protein